MCDFELLTSIGFTVTTTCGVPEVRFPDGSVVPDRALERARQMSGRLSNLAYMARSMDRYDRVDRPAAGSAPGDMQFEHLLAQQPAGALIYFALRRLQRAGDIAMLRQGLAILLAYDHGELMAEDAVAALWPDGVSRPAALPARPTTPVALSATPGL